MNPKTAAAWIAAYQWLKDQPSAPRILAQEAEKRFGVAMRQAKPVRLSLRLPKRVKPETLPKLKKELDRVFSIFIRTRHASPATGQVKCITCGRQDHWKSMHCGHYVRREKLATRWDEDNCRVQGAECNTFRGGEPEKFAEWLDENYGPGTAARLREKGKGSFRPTRDWLKSRISHYKKQIGEQS